MEGAQRSAPGEQAMQSAHPTATRHLPAQLTSLIGREEAVASACALLRRPEVRLLTLTGSGGIGKTRLGLQVAFELQHDFADGVEFVPLASLRDPEQVLPTIAHTLGLRESGDWPLLERLEDSLAKKRLLLLLDNFEPVLPAAPKLGALLASCPHLKLLVASRAVLHIQGEYEFQVAPLSLPDPSAFPDAKAVAATPAVTLFVQRAQARKADFQLTPANASTIAAICTHLDG